MTRGQKLKRLAISMLVATLVATPMTLGGYLTSGDENVDWNHAYKIAFITSVCVGWILYQVSINHINKKSNSRMSLEGVGIALLLIILLVIIL